MALDLDSAEHKLGVILGFLEGKEAPRSIFAALDWLTGFVRDRAEGDIEEDAEEALDDAAEEEVGEEEETQNGEDEAEEEPASTSVPARGIRWTNVEENKLVAMKNSGASWRDIAEELGRKVPAVQAKFYSMQN